MMTALAGDPTSGEEDDDEGWGEDDDVGFSDVPVEEVDPTKKPSPFHIGGTVRLNSSFWMERLKEQPWASMRERVDFEARLKLDWFRALVSTHAEADLVYLTNRDAYDDATIETYAWQVRPHEALVGIAVGPMELTLGRQVVSWGEGTLVSPVDVVAPRDLREPGLADLEELRLPVTAARVDFFYKSWRLQMMAVPETWFGYRSPPAGPFGPLPALLEESGMTDLVQDKQFAYAHEQKRFDLNNSQGFVRLSYRGRLDLAFYGATVLDQQGLMILPDTLTFLLEDDLEIGLDHLRYTMVGHSGTASVGDFLFRWELSADIDRPVNVGNVEALPPVLEGESTYLLNGMIGTQFSGIPKTTIDLEIGKGWFPSPPEEMLFPLDLATGALRVSHRNLRERLQLGAVGMMFGVDGRYGGLIRLDASYELADGLRLGLCGISYFPGKERGPLLGLEEHDRLDFKFRWEF
ncbi:MAG: hypothetical protein HN348_32680 [Proteobacteria bacterium]|nr:hypothetical protein [Pseudomonadota bacterium]